MAEVGIAGAIIAITQICKELLPESVKGWVTIVVAAIIGILAGLAGLEGLNWLTGLILGLTAAGAVKVAKSIAGK